MQNFDKIKKILTEQKPKLKEEYGISEIGVFGSYVRNEQRQLSEGLIGPLNYMLHEPYICYDPRLSSSSSPVGPLSKFYGIIRMRCLQA